MKFKTSNSRMQGNVGLGSAIAYYTLKGYVVSVPLTDSQEYDLIFDDGNKLNKVQVKTSECLSEYNIYKVNLRVCGGNRTGTGKYKKFDNKEVDFVFVLTSSGETYNIPSLDIECVNSISLGDKYRKYLV